MSPLSGLQRPARASKITDEIVNQVRQDIASGRLDPGERLPNERELAALFGVSQPTIRESVRVLEAMGTTDGAAALLLASTDVARALSDDPIEIVGLGLASDVAYSHWKPTFDGLPVTAAAAHAAYTMAGISPSDIDVAELHDCFSVAELLAYEDLGFCSRGDASGFVASGATQRSGSLPCNPSGGLIAKGHPIGATGVAQMAEIYWQLRGEAGRRQVGEPKIGLTHNVGGNGQICSVNIARRTS